VTAFFCYLISFNSFRGTNFLHNRPYPFLVESRCEAS
jgi:hypothetical protein